MLIVVASVRALSRPATGLFFVRAASQVCRRQRCDALGRRMGQCRHRCRMQALARSRHGGRRQNRRTHRAKKTDQYDGHRSHPPGSREGTDGNPAERSPASRSAYPGRRHFSASGRMRLSSVEHPWLSSALRLAGPNDDRSETRSPAPGPCVCDVALDVRTAHGRPGTASARRQRHRTGGVASVYQGICRFVCCRPTVLAAVPPPVQIITPSSIMLTTF